MKKTLLIAFIFIFYLTVLLNALEKQVYSPAGTAEKKIAILYHPTQFRNDVVTKVKDRFNQLNFEVILDNALQAKYYDPKDYDLMIIFTGIHAFIPDAIPVNYIRKNKKNKNMLAVFCTFLAPQGVNLKKNLKNKPDTITAASLSANSDPLIDKIVEVALEKLN